MRQVSRDMSYRAKIVFFGYLAFITIVAIILSMRVTPAVQPEALPQTPGNGGVYFALVAMLLYFLPSFAPWGKRNWGAIFLLNLLLGWTLIGWIVALVWGWTIEAPRPKSLQTTGSDS
jgi:hypothetical protein